MSKHLSRALADGAAHAYLLHGEERFLIREAMTYLRGQVLQGMAEDFNLDRFDLAERVDVDRIVQAARTLPMMAPRRLVWVRHAEKLFQLGADALKPITAYLESPDPSACLVLEAPGKFKKTAALYKRMKKHGCVFEAAPLKERALAGWVQERAQLKGRAIRPDAAALLVEAVGANLAGLVGALDRLFLYVEGDAPIQAEHVEETISHTRTRTVWELVDAVADRRVARALERAHQLLDQGAAPLALMGLVTRQFRQLLVGRSLRARGASADECAAAAGVPPFRARAFAGQLDRYSGRELLAAMEALARADRALKGSKLPDELIFEGLLLELCAPR